LLWRKFFPAGAFPGSGGNNQSDGLGHARAGFP
jgi:hypothetical protein